MKIITRIVAATALFIFWAATASAQGLPQAKSPEEVGFSSERLKRISAALQADIDKGTIPGVVTLIVRKGKVAYYEALGYQNREEKIPMKRNSIFRIASMTKPFTSLAIMMLAAACYQRQAITRASVRCFSTGVLWIKPAWFPGRQLS